MKKNRSNIWTVGVTNVANKEYNLKYPFFEYDTSENATTDDKVLLFISDVYQKNYVDYVRHRTGRGWHFLSPRVLSADEWKSFMKNFEGINNKCPMTTLRIQPNKYDNEKSVWLLNHTWYTNKITKNSHTMSEYLNLIFNTKFRGEINSLVEKVRYPLPVVDKDMI